MGQIEFFDQQGSFRVHQPENYSGLYFPVAGDGGLKSCVTPTLGGDSKTDQNHFLLEPVSIENLHNNKNTRNFWCRVKNRGYWSACGSSAEAELQRFTEEQDESVLEAGFMWQKLTRSSRAYGLKAEITSFVTVDGAVEVMMTELTNMTEETLEITPVAVMPVYGRSADNIRDHRHVTSLLHRIRTTEYGVEVTPTMSFDERGHQKNKTTYFVYGSTGAGEKPASFYPTVEALIGEGGSFFIPEAVRTEKPGIAAGILTEGKEAVGGIRFADISIKPHEKVCYNILAGITDDRDQIETLTAALRKEKQVRAAYDAVKRYWTEKVNVTFKTGNPDADNYMRWITFQPVLRRIYGCSFLPYHDYGKGGRGWRDLWQDCLALLLMDPSEVRQMIVDHFGGVRIDGTNATIIGNAQGEFIADRNHITRVWMDHAFWPFVTTKFYIDQTGDLEVLFERVPYFKDLQSKRGTDHDAGWNAEYGERQRTEGGEVYFGSILEHLLLQNLCAFYDVGEHNEIRLHGADWNDALDMAWENGESVAFTSAYAENLKEIAQCIRWLEQTTGWKRFEIAEEMEILFAGGREVYESVEKKREILARYLNTCSHNLSGQMVIVKTEQVCRNLEEKADWLMEHIRANEWITEDEEHGWFNGYYDNHKNPVEGLKDGKVRMMLTSQVFAIMSKTATEEQVRKICRSADRYLYDEKAGGYRLNTDFDEEKTDLGRMFGFAYGEKENGAVFSHMAVMYANALYRRGFAREGYKVLQSLLDAAMRFENSRMYPGLPEYFDLSGRGMYAYLTGAASWYLLTMVTEVFGVKGMMGDLVIAPSLMPEQFDEQGNAEVKLTFAGKKFRIIISNPEKCECKRERVKEAFCDGNPLEMDEGTEYVLRIKQEWIKHLPAEKEHIIKVVFGR